MMLHHAFKRTLREELQVARRPAIEARTAPAPSEGDRYLTIRAAARGPTFSI